MTTPGAPGPCRRLTAALWLLLCVGEAAAATFVVTTAADSGAGSLRQAITDANAAAGTDTITFAIPDAGVPRIQPLTALPAITSPVILDGTTQSPAALVEIDGSAGTGTRGVDVTAGASTLRGLVVNGFSAIGIRLALGGANTVEGCIVGTDPTATLALATAAVGIDVSSAGNQIGGGTPETANVIAGNKGGISIHGGTATANVVAGNFIGTDATGATSIGNRSYGISISSATDNVIGGAAPGAGNVIGGNRGDGVIVTGSTAAANAIQGNWIGVAADASTPIPNATHGIRLLSGAHDNTIGGTVGNVIASNGDNGVILAITALGGNTIRGNAIRGNGALGIDLYSAGVTPNDPGDTDTGANLQQNYPLLEPTFAGGTMVAGSLDSAPDALFVIEVFASPSCDPSGYGEGAELVSTLVIQTDAAGFASFGAPLARPVDAAAEVLTATATDAAGNTSEFSPCAPGPAVTTTTSTTSTTVASTSTTSASTTSTTGASTTSTTSLADTTTTSSPVSSSTTSTVAGSTTTSTSSTAAPTTTVAASTTTSTTGPGDTTTSTTVTSSSSTSTTAVPASTTTTTAPTSTTTSAPTTTSTSSTAAPTTTVGPSTTTSTTDPDATTTSTTTTSSTSTSSTVAGSTTTTTSAPDTTTSSTTAPTTTTGPSTTTSTPDPGATTTSTTSPSSTSTSTTDAPASTTTTTEMEPTTTSTTGAVPTTTTSTTEPGATTTTTSSTTVPVPTTTSTTAPTTTTTLAEPPPCPAAPSFPSLACRLDALGTTVHTQKDLGLMRDRLMRQVSRARVALDTAAARCDPARPGPARHNLRRVAKRLAAVRRRLRSPRAQRLVPPALATPLLGEAGRLVDDARTLGSALHCN